MWSIGDIKTLEKPLRKRPGQAQGNSMPQFDFIVHYLIWMKAYNYQQPQKRSIRKNTEFRSLLWRLQHCVLRSISLLRKFILKNLLMLLADESSNYSVSSRTANQTWQYLEKPSLKKTITKSVRQKTGLKWLCWNIQ